jgi:hypothetical protein
MQEILGEIRRVAGQRVEDIDESARPQESLGECQYTALEVPKMLERAEDSMAYLLHTATLALVGLLGVPAEHLQEGLVVQLQKLKNLLKLHSNHIRDNVIWQLDFILWQGTTLEQVLALYDWLPVPRDYDGDLERFSRLDRFLRTVVHPPLAVGVTDVAKRGKAVANAMAAVIARIGQLSGWDELLGALREELGAQDVSQMSS